MNRPRALARRCGRICAAWERVCDQLEQAGRIGFEPLPLLQAVATIERMALSPHRVPLRADYRDRMLMAVVKAKVALLESGSYVAFASEEPIDEYFDALAVLIVIWSEHQADTRCRPTACVADACATVAWFRRRLHDICRQDEETAQIIRAHENQVA